MFFNLRSASIIACLATALLTACGGGGSSAPSSPTQIVLSSSAGDLTKYVGSWSACGFIASGTTLQYVNATYRFGGSVSPTVMPGTVTALTYTGSNCTGTLLSTASNPFTATFISSANAVSTTSGSTVVFSGTADTLSLQEYSRATGALVGAALTQYPAFSSSFTELRMKNSPSYSSTDLVLRK